MRRYLNLKGHSYLVGIAVTSETVDYTEGSDDSVREIDEYGVIDKTLLSDERNRTLFQWSPLAIVIVNQQGVILDSNRKMYEWLGYEPEHIIGKNLLELPFLSEESKKTILRKFTRRLLGEKLPPYEIPFYSKNGEIIWGEIHGSLFKDDASGTMFDLVMIVDITQKMKAVEKLRESEERFRMLFEHANVLIQSVNAEGRFVEVNPKWISLMEYTQEEVNHLTIHDILRQDQIEYCDNIFQRLKQGELSFDIQIVFRSKSGREIPVMGNVKAIFKDGVFVSTIGIFREHTS